MKVFISILFSLFFVPMALSDAPHTVHCGKGEYKPAGQYGCSDCHDRCGPSKYLPEYTSDCAPCVLDTSTLKYVCPEGAMTRGFYCPYDRSYGTNLNEHQGLEQCPSGFADAVANQQDDKQCHAHFHFYPGNGTTFRGATFTGDQSYDTIMYYKVASDLFTASADGLTHKLKPEFITGASAPTNPKYYFNGWKWGKKAINGNVLWVDVDENTDIKSEGDDTEEYRHIRAKWKYDVLYIVDAASLYAVDLGIKSGEKYTLLKNTVLPAWNMGTNSLVHPIKYLTRDGLVFKGWCPHPLGNNLCNNGADILKPGKKICDTEDCGAEADKQIVPNDNKYVNLYAVFDTCDDTLHRVADTGLNLCVCDKGYWGPLSPEDGLCQQCENGMTTDGPGKTDQNACKHMFKYKQADGSDATWGWSTNVVDTSGTVSNIH